MRKDNDSLVDVDQFVFVPTFDGKLHQPHPRRDSQFVVWCQGQFFHLPFNTVTHLTDFNSWMKSLSLPSHYTRNNQNYHLRAIICELIRITIVFQPFLLPCFPYGLLKSSVFLYVQVAVLKDGPEAICARKENADIKGR